MAEEGSFLGPNLRLFIENLSQQGITVQVRDVSVNGFMVDSSLSAEVLPNKRAYTELTLIESDLEKNGITAVNEIDLPFHIFESERDGGFPDPFLYLLFILGLFGPSRHL